MRFCHCMILIAICMRVADDWVEAAVAEEAEREEDEEEEHEEEIGEKEDDNENE